MKIRRQTDKPIRQELHTALSVPYAAAVGGQMRLSLRLQLGAGLNPVRIILFLGCGWYAGRRYNMEYLNEPPLTAEEKANLKLLKIADGILTGVTNKKQFISKRLCR